MSNLLLHKLINIIGGLPIELRKKLHGVRFIVDEDSFTLMPDGSFIKAMTLGKNEIIFYEPFIGDGNDLRETLIHELCHHFGMDEQEVRRFMKDERK